FDAPNHKRGLAQVAPRKGITQRLVPRTPIRYPLRVEFHTLDVDNQGVPRFDSPDIDWPSHWICLGRRIVQVPRVKQPSRILRSAINARARVLCPKRERFTEFDLQDGLVLGIDGVLQ